MGKGTGSCQQRSPVSLLIEGKETPSIKTASQKWKTRQHTSLIFELQQEVEKRNKPQLLPVVSIIADEQRRTAYYWSKSQKEVDDNEDHNIFLLSSAEKFLSVSKQTRSLTSRKGFELQRIARQLLENKFGQENVPKIVFCQGLSAKPSIEQEFEAQLKNGDGLIISNYNKNLVESEADRLVSLAKEMRKEGKGIGSKAFQQEVNQSIKLIKQETKESEYWSIDSDLIYFDDNNTFFVEMKSGGDLDTSNGPKQIAKLLKSQLAYGYHNSKIIFACAYSNRGEGKTISGAVPYFFETDKANHNRSLRTGKTWWETILPTDTDYNDFIDIYQKVGKVYQIKP